MRFVKVPNILFDFYEIDKPGTFGNKKTKVKYYDLKPMDYRVYIYLLTCSGFQSQSSMKLKYKTIASGCGVRDPKTARSSVNRLIAQGLLEKQKRFNKWGNNAANGYRLSSLSGGYFMFDTGYFASGLSVPDTCVLLYLLKCKDKSQHSFPSVADIAYISSLSKVTVRKSLTWLTQRFFVRKDRYICKCGDFGNNHYRIFSRAEQYDLLAPYRQIKAKAPEIFQKTTQQANHILRHFILKVLSYIFFKFEVGKIFPNTS